jgi:hypothetical protein
VRRPFETVLWIVVLLGFGAPIARAELPAARTALADVGYSASEISAVEAGQIVTGEAKPAHERDIAVAFAFLVPLSPAELVAHLAKDQHRDPNTIATGSISAAGALADFAALSLQPDAAQRARRYVTATPDSDLNLSEAELSAFRGLGSAAPTAAVEAQVRSALLERYRAYRDKGLDGISPYARGGDSRSIAHDLRVSLESVAGLRKYAPAAYEAMMSYPAAAAPGSESRFTWDHFPAHGILTIALVHEMYVPDGNAFLILQRQYYVSETFNCEQAVAGFLPVQGGTVVVYTNHTSTDQVMGLGGGAKRSIGSELMASQLRELFARVQKGAR